MNYKKLVADVAQRAGLHTEIVSRVLYYLPDALLHLEVGDGVRTPLGVFRMRHTPERPITLPDQKSQAIVAEKTIVKLRSGSRLRVDENEDASGND